MQMHLVSALNSFYSSNLKHPVQIIILNFRQELSILAQGAGSELPSSKQPPSADDCSDLMVKSSSTNSAFLGHNEDNTLDTKNTTYFVQAFLVCPMSLPSSTALSCVN